MKIRTNRSARAIAALVILSVLGGCGLPRSGPTKQQFLASSVERKGDAFIVDVDDRIAAATAFNPGSGFSQEFRNAGTVNSDTIWPGDILSIAVWENVEQGVLSGGVGSTTMLDAVQVDSAGFIFMPYAGRIRAAGDTPEALRQTITRLLESQTPDPQVTVGRAAGDGATVTIIGKIGGQGNYPLERPNRTLTSMIAQAGGISIESEIARVTVIRGSHRATIWLEDLYADPSNDIALRPNDRILVEEDTRAFIAMGATGGQRRVDFDKKALSAIEAIAQSGGLNPSTADPTGIFVLREESADLMNSVLGRRDLTGEQRVAYVIDLTKPSGVFIARDFLIRDEDTIFVTEAPFVQWQKTLSALTGTAGTANNLASLANNNN